jgi:hypothetical protein
VGASRAAALLLVVTGLGALAACGDDAGSGTLSHDDAVSCLDEAGLDVAEGGRISGKPAISVAGGSALVVVFDSSADAETEAAEDPTGFFSEGETDARGNAFVYFAPAASSAVRTEVEACLPEASG